MVTADDVIRAVEGLGSQQREAALGRLAPEQGAAAAFAEAVRRNHLAVEACVGFSGGDEVLWDLRPEVIAINRAVERDQRVADRLARLDPDVAIAVCLAGTHDPDAACERLFGSTDRWESVEVTYADVIDGEPQPEETIVRPSHIRFAVRDGYAYARGVTPADLRAALHATRR